jgi:hypothetical protein
MGFATLNPSYPYSHRSKLWGINPQRLEEMFYVTRPVK